MVTPAAGAAAAAMVAPEWRARALAVVLAGLSGATALGAPIGTLVGSFADWRMTMWFVAGLGTLASVGVLAVLPGVPTSSPLRLRDRLAPLGDARVAATLATTLLAMFGVFLIYTYISVVFDRATGGDGTHLAALMSSLGHRGNGRNSGRGQSDRSLRKSSDHQPRDPDHRARLRAHPLEQHELRRRHRRACVWGLCGWGLVVVATAPIGRHRADACSNPDRAQCRRNLLRRFGVRCGRSIGDEVLDPHDLPFLSTS